MGHSLNPTLSARVSQLLRPEWTRTLRARRAAAAALVLLAGVAAFRSEPGGERTDVVVAARDIGPGTPLTAADVALESRLTATVPDGATTQLATVSDATAAGPVRRGEVLTDVRLVGRRLAEAAAGPNSRIVGVHPSDAALTDLLRAGDVVDVVAAASGDPAATAKVVASGAVVVMVSARQQQHTDDRVVLLALPAAAATAVAGAALVQTVTLTLR